MLPSAFYYGRVAIRQSSFAACGVLLPKGTCVAGSGSKKQEARASGLFFFSPVRSTEEKGYFHIHRILSTRCSAQLVLSKYHHGGR